MTFTAEHGGDVVEFSMATLDDAIDLLPEAYAFTNYMFDWDLITDHLPQFRKVGLPIDSVSGQDFSRLNLIIKADSMVCR